MQEKHKLSTPNQERERVKMGHKAQRSKGLAGEGMLQQSVAYSVFCGTQRTRRKMEERRKLRALTLSKTRHILILICIWAGVRVGVAVRGRCSFWAGSF